MDLKAHKYFALDKNICNEEKKENSILQSRIISRRKDDAEKSLWFRIHLEIFRDI